MKPQKVVRFVMVGEPNPIPSDFASYWRPIWVDAPDRRHFRGWAVTWPFVP